MNSMSDSWGLLLMVRPVLIGAGSAACPRSGCTTLYSSARRGVGRAEIAAAVSVGGAHLADEVAHLRQRQVAAHHPVVEDEGRRAGDRQLLGQRAGRGEPARRPPGSCIAGADRRRVEAGLGQRLVEADVGDLALQLPSAGRAARRRPPGPRLISVATAARAASSEPGPRIGISLTISRMSPSARDQLGHLRLRAAAEAALVVEELDDGEAALGVAADPGEAVVEDLRGVGWRRASRSVSAVAACCFSSRSWIISIRISGLREQVGADLGVQRRALGLAEGRGHAAAASSARRRGSVRRRGRQGEQGSDRNACVASAPHFSARRGDGNHILRPPPPRRALGQQRRGARGVALGVAERGPRARSARRWRAPPRPRCRAAPRRARGRAARRRWPRPRRPSAPATSRASAVAPSSSMLRSARPSPPRISGSLRRQRDRLRGRRPPPAPAWPDSSRNWPLSSR